MLIRRKTLPTFEKSNNGPIKIMLNSEPTSEIERGGGAIEARSRVKWILDKSCPLEVEDKERIHCSI